MTINLSNLNVPGVYVNNVIPRPSLNGVPTDLICNIGTATWGPKNSPVPHGPIQEYVQLFGVPKARKYDMGTHVYLAGLQGASNFRSVRVTDGTDAAAVGNLRDTLSTPSTGAILTAKYTGSTGNTLSAVISQGTSSTVSAPTYKLTVALSGSLPESYDNIGGVGAQFWTNLVNAVNLGQSLGRGPSQIVIASAGTSVSAITVTTAGSYTSVPTASVTSTTGSGATLQSKMKLLTAAGVANGTGYSVGDQLLFTSQGTFTASAILEVGSVDGSGAISTFSIINAGIYSVLPTGTLTPTSTTGSGTGATFTFNTYGINNIAVTAGGVNYKNTDTVTISGSGGGIATVSVGSAATPSTATVTFTGGTDGADGVTDAIVLGSDATNPRTGMYAARNAVAGGMLVLCDVTDETTYTLQNRFCLDEFCYGVGAMTSGLQDSLTAAATIVQDSAVDSTLEEMAPFIATMGDYVYFTDVFNNVNRYVSPQPFRAGVLASLSPNQSSLNKELTGIIGTQKTIEGRTYSNADLSFLRTARIDVLTNPIPAGQLFGWRFGTNISSNIAIQTDNYVRMVNMMLATIQKGMGIYVGQGQTIDTWRDIKATLDSYFGNMFTQKLIGDVRNPGSSQSAFQVVVDASNNPADRIKLGYTQVDVRVCLQGIILYLIVNMNAQQGVSAQVTTQAA